MEILRHKQNQKIIGFRMSESEYASLRDNYNGLCFSCGETQDGVEPDARRYECDSCEKKSVFVIEEALILGAIYL